MGDDLVIQWKAFPLRPEPDPSVAFKGTYREEGWRRCGAMAAGDGITFTPWPRDDFERGYRAQMAGRLDEAIECYRRSLAIRPSAEAHTFIGWALSYQGKHEEAIAECRHAIAVDPTFGNPYN